MTNPPKLTLERWAALDAAASPGPWGVAERLSGSENHRGFRLYDEASEWFFADVQPADEDGVEGRANADFIAASRQAPTRLLAALRGLPTYEAVVVDGGDLEEVIRVADLHHLIETLDLAAPPQGKQQ